MMLDGQVVSIPDHRKLWYPFFYSGSVPRWYVVTTIKLGIKPHRWSWKPLNYPLSQHDCRYDGKVDWQILLYGVWWAHAYGRSLDQMKKPVSFPFSSMSVRSPDNFMEMMVDIKSTYCAWMGRSQRCTFCEETLSLLVIVIDVHHNYNKKLQWNTINCTLDMRIVRETNRLQSYPKEQSHCFFSV